MELLHIYIFIHSSILSIYLCIQCNSILDVKELLPGKASPVEGSVSQPLSSSWNKFFWCGVYTKT